jgi:uncharacterized protein
MTLLQESLHTYLFLIPLVVLVCSETAKIITEWYMTGAWHRRIFQHGGLPSSHSAFVTSLLIVVGRKTGLESVEFAMAVVFACIVWYDAVAIRGTIGEQAKVINLMQELYRLSEKVGHSLIEAIAGILFGGAITMLGIWLS